MIKMKNLEKQQNLLKKEANVGRDLGNVELQKNNSKSKSDNRFSRRRRNWTKTSAEARAKQLEISFSVRINK